MCLRLAALETAFCSTSNFTVSANAIVNSDEIAAKTNPPDDFSDPTLTMESHCSGKMV